MTKIRYVKKVPEPVKEEDLSTLYTIQFITGAVFLGGAFICLYRMSPQSQTNHGTFYTTVTECTLDGYGYSVCNQAWEKAKQEYYAAIPRDITEQSCKQQYHACQHNEEMDRWIPEMTGFLVRRAYRDEDDAEYAYNNHGHRYATFGVWKKQDGDYAWRSAAGKIATTREFRSLRAETSSRGGYGNYSHSYRKSMGG